MTKPKYIQFIDQSVEGTRDTIEYHELLGYMIDPDKPEIDVEKAEKDGLERYQVYELSSYSTLLEVRDRLHKLWKEGSVRPIRIAHNDDEEESGIPDELKSILESIGEDKKLDGAKIVTIDFSDMPKDAQEYLHNALMKLVDPSKEIKELKKGKK